MVSNNVGANAVVSALKLMTLAILTAIAWTVWFSTPFWHLSMPLRVWFAAGFVGTIIIGVIGATFTRMWFWVPVVVAAGLLAGATWSEWRTPHDIDYSLLDNFEAAISIYGSWLLAPGLLGAVVGVGIVRFSLLWRARRQRNDSRDLPRG